VIDHGPKCAAAAQAVEAWFAEEHDEPSALVNLVVVAEMRTLSGELWITVCTATGTDGNDDVAQWQRNGMLHHAMDLVGELADDDD